MSPTLGTCAALAAGSATPISQTTASSRNGLSKYIFINVLLRCSWCNHRRHKRLWQVGGTCGTAVRGGRESTAGDFHAFVARNGSPEELVNDLPEQENVSVRGDG